MKYLAHRKPDGSDKPISIDDVIKGRKSIDVENWEEGVIYYSLWYYTPMKAVVNVTQKRPHFSFVNGSDPGHQNGGESIEHSFSKKIVSEIKVLKVSVYKKSYEIPIKEGRMEHPEQFRGRDYRIDVLLQAEPCPFTNEYGSTQIGIEIKKSSKVKSRKQYALRNVPEKMVLLEISLWDKITLDDSYNVEKLYRELLDYWKKEKIAFCLHNPNYKIGFAKHKENESRERLQRLEQLKKMIPVAPVTKPIPVRTVASEQRITLPERKEHKAKLKSMIVPLLIIIVLIVLLTLFILK
jgi:hypothetical protein